MKTKQFNFKTFLLALIGVLCIGVNEAKAVDEVVVTASGYEKKYSNFNDAWADAQNREGSTITLLYGSGITSTLTYNGTATNVTIDLNGKVFYANSDISTLILVNKSGGKLTIKDGLGNGIARNLNRGGKRVFDVLDGELVIEGGTISAAPAAPASGNTYTIRVYGASGVATIKGGTIIANGSGNVYPLITEAGTANVQGGTLYATGSGGSNYFGVRAQGGTINISGNPTIYSEGTSGTVAAASNAATMNIAGGKFYSNSSLFHKNKPTLTGGYFKGNPGTASSGYSTVAVETDDVLSSEGYTYRVIPSAGCEAKVSANNATKYTYFNLFADAFTYAKTLETSKIVLVKNTISYSGPTLRFESVPDGANCTLDLNGKTFNGNATSDAPNMLLIVSKSGATFTITDSHGGGEFTHVKAYAGALYNAGLWSNGTLNISGGTVYCKNTTSGKEARGVANTGGYLNVTGGTVKAEETGANYASGVFVQNVNNTSISGGSIIAEGKWAMAVRVNSGSAAISGNSTITATSTVADGWARAVYMEASGGSATISGGTVSATAATVNNAYCVDAHVSGSSATISGGKFSTTSSNIVYKHASASFTITGGYFNELSDQTTHKNLIKNYVSAPKYVFETTDLGADYKWKVATGYVISYDKGANGTGTIDDGIKEDGVAFTLSNNTFTRAGYTQTGWSASDGGGKAYDLGGTYTANAGTTLYPFWTINVASVTAGSETKEFTTFAEAFTFAKAKASATIKLLQPTVTYSGAALEYSGTSVPANATCTLDLNGKTLTGVSTGSYLLVVNKTGVTFTITDSGSGGKFIHEKAQSGTLYNALVWNGTLNIAGGTVHCKNTTSGQAVRAIGNTGDAATSILNVTNGLIKAEPNAGDGVGVFAQKGSTTSVSGGEIQASGTSAFGVWAYDAAVMISGTPTITATSTTSGARAVAVKKDAKSSASVSISGGTFTASANTASNAICVETMTSGSSAYISGGKFTTAGNEIVKHLGASFSITGGYFNESAGTQHKDQVAARCTGTKYPVLMSNSECTSVGMPNGSYKVMDTYTVTVNVSPAGYGSVSPTSVEHVPSGTAITSSSNTFTVNGTTVTATAAGATAQYTYAFSSWTNASGTVTGPKTVTANFSTIVNKYTITWVDGNGATLKTEQVEYGATPAYTGATPTKTATAEYTYTFNNTWSPAIVAVTGAKTYTAQFNSTKNSYEITWLNDDNSLIDKTTVEYGVVPTHAVATKAATAEWTYTFTGWDNTPVAVTGPATYKATFSATKNKYTVTWKNHDGTTLETDENVEYGTTPSYDGATPTKTATAEYSYTFIGWGPAIAEVTGDATYTAQFSSAANPYELTWDLDGGYITSEPGTYTAAGMVNCGASVEAPNVEKEGYQFSAWDPSVDAYMPAHDVTYKATWSAITYNISYTLDGGTVDPANPSTYTADDAITLRNPEKPGHTFVGWTGSNGETPEMEVIIAAGSTGNKSYTAHWAINSYTITWKVDGTTVKTETLEYGEMPNYGEDPTKEMDVQYTYAFSGWTPAPYAVDKDQIYDGSFIANLRYYTITWKDADGSDLEPATTSVQYGLRPTHDAPTKEGCNFAGWKASSDNTIWTASQQLPYVGAEETYTAVYACSLSELDVVGEKTISDDTETNVTTVRVTGRLSIEEGKSLTTDDLILEASAIGSGEIVDDARINVHDHAYFDLDLNTDDWHWTSFGVPFEINLAQHPLIQKRDEAEGGDRTLVLGRDYDIVYYNGVTRAEQGPVYACWEYVQHHGQTLVPGKAYLIAFNHGIGHVAFVRFEKADAAPVAYSTAVPLTHTGSTINDNWNGIANPRMYHTLLGAGVAECQVHNGEEIRQDGYILCDMNDKKFYVGKAAFIQVPEGKSVLEVSQAEKSDAPVVALLAPRRSGRELSSGRFDVQIAPQDGEMSDRIFVLAEDDKADEYVIVSDLAKAGVSTTRAQMWVDRYGAKLCKNTTAFVGNKASYPLSLYAPSAGTYEISTVNAPEGYTLYLTRNGNVIWNLCTSAYPASLEQGTTTEYGLRLVKQSPQVTTEVEVTGDGLPVTGAQKVIIDDKVFILRGGNVYSADGQQIQ